MVRRAQRMSLPTAGPSAHVPRRAMSIIRDDLIERSVNIHWPGGYDPDHADLFAHNTIIIDAPAGTIWAKLIDAAAWPTWYSNASDVVVNDPSGTLGEGVSFDWTTF